MGRVESRIQADIILYLNSLDATYSFNVGGGASTAKGTPDILCCHHGRFIAFEVKRPDGSYGTTKTQDMRIAAILRAEGEAYVVTSIQDVATALFGKDAV